MFVCYEVVMSKKANSDQKFFSFKAGIEPLGLSPKVGDICPDCGEKMIAEESEESEMSPDEFIDRAWKLHQKLLDVTSEDSNGAVAMYAMQEALAVYLYNWVKDNNLNLDEARKNLNNGIDESLEALKNDTYYQKEEN